MGSSSKRPAVGDSDSAERLGLAAPDLAPDDGCHAAASQQQAASVARAGGASSSGAAAAGGSRGAAAAQLLDGRLDSPGTPGAKERHVSRRAIIAPRSSSGATPCSLHAAGAGAACASLDVAMTAEGRTAEELYGWEGDAMAEDAPAVPLPQPPQQQQPESSGRSKKRQRRRRQRSEQPKQAGAGEGVGAVTDGVPCRSRHGKKRCINELLHDTSTGQHLCLWVLDFSAPWSNTCLQSPNTEALLVLCAR